MPKRCDLCNINDLEDHDFASHISGKKHLKKAELENSKKVLVERSVYVSRMPPGLSTSEVQNFFGRFGRISRLRVEKYYAIVEYQTKEPVNFLLSRSIWMGDYQLVIRRRTLADSGLPNKAQSLDSEKSVCELNFAELKTKMQTVTTFDNELSAFLDYVQLDEHDVERNWQLLHNNLREALLPPFPGCEITRFGSSFTGLALKGSDFDVYLNIGQPISEENDNDPALGAGRTGWTAKNIFNEVKYRLYKNKNYFEKIVLIPKAKTPIIKFCHTPTGVNCDISFKNGLAVINSQLIKHFLSLDVRLKPFMLVIKLWAKSLELTGPGKFTSYAIIMLIIFYLQQPETRILPPIVDLQNNGEPTYLLNWQVNFDRSIVPPSSNTSSLTELLLGFYKFYSNFPFESKLICPLDGFAHSRVDYAKVCKEKGGDADYLALDRPICVQDPIELDNNITVGVVPKVLESFQNQCTVGVQICEEALLNEGKPYLLILFTTVPARLENVSFVEIIIPSQRTLHTGLPSNLDNRTDIINKQKFIEDNWFCLVQKLIEETLTRVFKLELQPLKMKDAKQQKVAETSDVHSKDINKVMFVCKGSYCVTTNRKSKGFCIDPTLSWIDKEALISDEVLKTLKANGVGPTKIAFTCTCIRERNPVRIILQLNDHGSAKKRFRPFATHLTTKLPSIIVKELIHMLQYNKQCAF